MVGPQSRELLKRQLMLSGTSIHSLYHSKPLAINVENLEDVATQLLRTNGPEPITENKMLVEEST